MLRESDNEIILIDFGTSKQYDVETNMASTTTTPVGISAGYAPIEQYRKGGVSSFSPESDIYALGATLYKLLTGITPPESIALEDE
jgi:serine/threonine protein kinase